MSMYIMKPWYKTNSGGNTTTFATMSDTFTQASVNIVSGKSKTFSTYCETADVYQALIDSYNISSISTSSRVSKSTYGLPMFGTTSSVSTITYATVTSPYLHVTKSWTTVLAPSFSETAIRKTLTNIYTASAGYFLSTVTGLTDSSSSYISATFLKDRDYDRGFDFVPLGRVDANGVLANYSLRVNVVTTWYHGNPYVFANKVGNDVFNDHHIVSGTARVILANGESTNTYTFYYPQAFVNVSDPSQVKQLVYTNSQYIMLEGTMSLTR